VTEANDSRHRLDLLGSAQRRGQACSAVHAFIDCRLIRKKDLKMPVNLERPAKDVDLTSAEYAVMLSNLQANILRAHGRNFARHLFLRFTGACKKYCVS